MPRDHHLHHHRHHESPKTKTVTVTEVESKQETEASKVGTNETGTSTFEPISFLLVVEKTKSTINDRLLI